MECVTPPPSPYEPVITCYAVHLHFGLGAWSNSHIDHTLYPLRTRHDEYLTRYATVFDVAEVDRMYHLPAEAQEMHGWAAGVPDGFRFLPKLHRTVVAEDKDDNALARADRFLAALAPLREAGRLGPVLAQFPASWGYTADDLEWLDHLMARAPPEGMVVELRNRTWWRDEVREALTARRVPLVWGTTENAPAPNWVTGPFGYVRFVGRHHDTRGRHPTVADRTEELLRIRDMLAAEPWQECFVIVTNTFEGNAVDSLPKIAAALGDEALAKRCTRQPGQVLFPDPVDKAQRTLGAFGDEEE